MAQLRRGGSHDRLESLLRSVFFWLMTPRKNSADHLDREAEVFRNAAAQYRALAAAKDRGDFGHSPQTQSLRIAAEAGIRITESLSDWAIWAEKHRSGQRSDTRYRA